MSSLPRDLVGMELSLRGMTTDSDPVIALSLLCRYCPHSLRSRAQGHVAASAGQEIKQAHRCSMLLILASPEPVAATRKRKSRKRSTSAVPESPTTVESSLSTYPTSSYRSTITTSPTLSTPSYSRYFCCTKTSQFLPTSQSLSFLH